MENLSLLVNLLSGTTISQLNVVGNKSLVNSNAQELYDKILSSKFQTDEEAAAYFYPDTAHQKKYYTRLKRQLEDRLLNTLFLLDLNRRDFTGYERTVLVCRRNMLAMPFLLAQGQRKFAIELGKKTLKKAIRFDLTEIALSLARDLRRHYATIEGQKKEYTLYNGYVKKYYNIWAYELKAEEYYSNLIIHYSYSKTSTPAILKEAISYTSELKKIISSVDSYRFRFMTYLIFVIRYEIENDYRNTLIVSEEAILYFTKKKKIRVRVAIPFFYQKMILCFIQLQQYTKAKETIAKCLELTQTGGYNWYVILEFRFLNGLRSKSYQIAYEAYLEVFNHPKFKSQYPNIIERWKINEAFIHFLILKKKIEVNNTEEKKNFKINKFLNEVPKHAKDKHGVNVTILVLQILFLLEQKRYDDIFERIEPLRMYTSRYLKKDGTFRSSCFIKMLMQLPAGHFHREAVKRKAAPYLKKLLSEPLDVAKQAAELEIIPYEELWEYVIEALEKKRYTLK